MTISSSSSALFSAPSPQYSDLARANKDSGDIARARQVRDYSAEQKAVAALRQDAPAPASFSSEELREPRAQDNSQEETRERLTVGANLDVKA